VVEQFITNMGHSARAAMTDGNSVSRSDLRSDMATALDDLSAELRAARAVVEALDTDHLCYPHTCDEFDNCLPCALAAYDSASRRGS
jgi:hypothetical protein